MRDQLAICRGEAGQVVDIESIEIHPRLPLAVLRVRRRVSWGTRSELELFDTVTGEERTIPGCQDVRAATWHANGCRVLVARGSAGGNEIVEVDIDTLEAEVLLEVTGAIESLRSTDDGLYFLEAEVGAELSDVHGSGVVADTSRPNWYPRVMPASEGRRVLRIRDSAGHVRTVTDANVWDFDARGDSVLMLASEHAGEGAWYGATLRISGGAGEIEVCRSPYQLAWPRLSHDGLHWSVLTGPASDRGVLAGDVVIDGRRVELDQVHASLSEWTPNGQLLVVGHRGFEVVIGTVDPAGQLFRPLWSSTTLTSGSDVPIAGQMASGDVLAVLEGHRVPPALCRVAGVGMPTQLLSTASPATDRVIELSGECDVVEWESSDGARIEGLLIRPEKISGLVVLAHGGPISAFHVNWVARDEYVWLLVSAGYAVFCPNPRGSSGRGNEFAAAVLGDAGGQDAKDITTGIEHLLRERIVPRVPVGITGNSYGGFLAAWLPCVCNLFAAAVARSPVTDWQLLDLTTNLRELNRLLVGSNPLDGASHYIARSPVRRVTPPHAPTLLTAGLSDLATPPSQAEAMYAALSDQGVDAAFAIYPLEGHGVLGFDARVDQCARMLDWFRVHLQHVQ
ncbi:prolyl oligopeptidase family serine peptidase [Microbacterium sp. KR10-403]|uniref:alpha/beta hydrolase family protein n=1 Tax=Microbacterium sp. KR10-403 TaxID=3158581 RepID=UPI0032E424AA